MSQRSPPEQTAAEASALRRRVLEHTRVAQPFLCPELSLHLATFDLPLWQMRPEALEAMGWRLPYWAFAWPGGQALARHLLDHPDLAREKRVLDFGAGSGLVALAAARCGARSVLAADIDPCAEVAIGLNAALDAEHTGVRLSTTIEDLLERSPEDPTLGDLDLVLAGDVCYEPELAARAVAWLQGFARRGATVLLGDPGRVLLTPSGLEPLASYRAPFDGDVRGGTLWETRVLRVLRVLRVRAASEMR